MFSELVNAPVDVGEDGLPPGADAPGRGSFATSWLASRPDLGEDGDFGNVDVFSELVNALVNVGEALLPLRG